MLIHRCCERCLQPITLLADQRFLLSKAAATCHTASSSESPSPLQARALGWPQTRMSALAWHLLRRSGPAAACQACWSACLRPGAGLATCAVLQLPSHAGCAGAQSCFPRLVGLLSFGNKITGRPSLSKGSTPSCSCTALCYFPGVRASSCTSLLVMTSCRDSEWCTCRRLGGDPALGMAALGASAEAATPAAEWRPVSAAAHSLAPCQDRDKAAGPEAAGRLLRAAACGAPVPCSPAAAARAPPVRQLGCAAHSSAAWRGLASTAGACSAEVRPGPAVHGSAARRGFAAAAEPAPAPEDYSGPEPMLEPHPVPRRRVPRRLPLDFGDPAAAFGAKSARELLLSWAVFSACQVWGASLMLC